MITSTWVKLVFAGKKKWLKAKEVVHANPPRYDEISVTQLYDYVMTLPRMAQYFPDAYPKGRSCNRKLAFCFMLIFLFNSRRLFLLHPCNRASLVLRAADPVMQRCQVQNQHRGAGEQRYIHYRRMG